MQVSMPQSFYTWAWIIWFAYFGIVETMALRDPGQGDTLSEYIWFFMFSENENTFSPRPVLFYLFAGFLVWLFAHFVFRGRFG